MRLRIECRLAALVAQFGAVLSLFLAHAVLQVVPQEAGRFGIQYRLRSAFVGGAGILCALFSEGQYLSAQEGLHALLPRKWGVHFRAADPGIWTVAARAQGRRAPLKGGGWQGYLQYDQGGTIQGRLQQWVVLGDDAKLGSGLARNARGIGSLLLSVGIQDWAAHHHHTIAPAASAAIPIHVAVVREVSIDSGRAWDGGHSVAPWFTAIAVSYRCGRQMGGRSRVSRSLVVFRRCPVRSNRCR